MTEIERLVALEDIKCLKARYFRALDTRETSLHPTLFTSTAQIDVRGSVSSDQSGPAIAEYDEGAIIVGGAGWASFVEKNSHSLLVTVHAGFMPEIEVLAPDRAKGIWGMEDRLWFKPGQAQSLLHGFGYYHETYVKLDGSWLIASMTIHRLRVEIH